MANGKNWLGLDALNKRYGRTPAERLANRSVRDPETGCLLWQGSKDTWGYGSLNFEGRPRRAHRVAWMLAHGPIPDDKIICHHCDTPACVNVEHLYVGTHQDNSDDITRRGRRNSRAGDLNPNRRLSSDVADQIRGDARDGPTLARMYNVNRSTINRIKRGVAWAGALLLSIGLVGIPLDASAEVRVIDGDTVKLDGVTMRLWAIDAPEKAQTCSGWPAGALSKTALELMVQGRKVECEPKTTDRYGRTVAICRADGMDVGAAMVSLGMAWAFVRYSHDYADQEAFARKNQRGIHAHDCQPAWLWRAEKR